MRCNKTIPNLLSINTITKYTITFSSHSIMLQTMFRFKCFHGFFYFITRVAINISLRKAINMKINVSYVSSQMNRFRYIKHIHLFYLSELFAQLFARCEHKSPLWMSVKQFATETVCNKIGFILRVVDLSLKIRNGNIGVGSSV